jgi:hypothetical protein
LNPAFGPVQIPKTLRELAGDDDYEPGSLPVA